MALVWVISVKVSTYIDRTITQQTRIRFKIFVNISVSFDRTWNFSSCTVKTQKITAKTMVISNFLSCTIIPSCRLIAVRSPCGATQWRELCYQPQPNFHKNSEFLHTPTFRSVSSCLHTKETSIEDTTGLCSCVSFQV